MAATTQDRALPLPRGWPRYVRSAVIQAISLAQFSLIADPDAHVVQPTIAG